MNQALSHFMNGFMSGLRYICRVLILGAVLAGIILLSFDLICYFFDSSEFTVQDITVEGHSRLLKEEIIAQTGIAQGANIWLLNLDEMEHRLESLPTIRRVGIRRIPPKRIHIAVEERNPIGFFYNKNTGRMSGVDQKGVILPPTVDPSLPHKTLVEEQRDVETALSVPLLTGYLKPPGNAGEQIQDPHWLNILEFLQALKDKAEPLFQEIAEVEWREDENLVLHPQRRIGVIVLRNLNAADLHKKLLAFWRVLEEENLRAIYVDARFPNKGFAVRFDESEGQQWKRLYPSNNNYVTQAGRKEG